MEHLGPKVVLGERGECLVASKMSHESASMSLLQKEKTKRRLGNTKFVSILDVISFPRCLRQTLGIRNRKRHVKTMGLSFRLSFATCRASVGEA